MASADLTAARLRELLHYEPATGVFTWRNAMCQGTIKAGTVAGCECRTNGYVLIRVDGRLLRAHRLAHLYMLGEWPSAMVDHRNTRRADNRWTNIRPANAGVNAQNIRRASRNSATGLLGIFPTRTGRFAAQIMANGVKHCLGTFDAPEDAYAAYLDAKRQLHPGCTL